MLGSHPVNTKRLSCVTCGDEFHREIAECIGPLHDLFCFECLSAIKNGQAPPRHQPRLNITPEQAAQLDREPCYMQVHDDGTITLKPVQH